MRHFGLSFVFLAAILLLASYLLTRGLAPDAEVHQRNLNTLLSLFLNDAQLRRDVLQARVGTVLNYDAINQRLTGLHDGVASLASFGSIASGSERDAIERARDGVAREIERHEEAVERFKSENALLQNSRRIFAHAAIGFGEASSIAEPDPIVLRAAIPILAFAEGGDAASRLSADMALADLRARFVLRPDDDQIETLHRHGELLFRLLPAVADLTDEISDDDVSASLRAVRAQYLHAYGDRQAMAGQVQFVLLGCTVVLGFYASLLLLRLLRGTQRLERRVSLEHAAATVAGRFLRLPSRETPEGIGFGLQHLVEETGGLEASMLVLREGQQVAAAYRWPSESRTLTADQTLSLFRRAGIGLDEIGFLACDAVPNVMRSHALLSFSVRDRSQSCAYVILTITGRRFGEDDRALFAIVVETFRSALERAYHEEERQTLQVQLARAQRLEALGTLAGSVAHEFNNILGAVRGHAELAMDGLTAERPPLHNVEQVLVGVSRAQGVIDKVLTFGRRRSDHKGRFDAGEALAEAMTLLRAALPEAIVLRVDAQPRLTLAGDALEFQQIVLNLCNNAAHAMNGAGEIHVSLARSDALESRRPAQGLIAAGSNVVLEVRDRGPGITPDVLEQIFDPFFTTKAVGVGTGLGLATVRDIVVAWGGGIDVESHRGTGTTMWVHLPLVSSEGAVSAAPSTLPRGRGEAVLLVSPSRDSLERDEETLATLGYEPVGFAEMSQALAAFEAEPDRFSAAIIHTATGDMSGNALSDAALTSGRPLPLILQIAAGEGLRTMDGRGRDTLPSPLPLWETATSLARLVRSPCVPLDPHRCRKDESSEPELLPVPARSVS